MSGFVDGFKSAKSASEQASAEERQKHALSLKRLKDLADAIRSDEAFLSEHAISLTFVESAPQLQLSINGKMEAYVNYSNRDAYTVVRSGFPSSRAKDQTEAAEKLGAIVFQILNEK